MIFLKCATIVLAVVIPSSASAEVSMLIADHGELVAEETIHPSPPRSATDVPVVTVGRVAAKDPEPIQLPPKPKVQSEPFIAAEPAKAAIQEPAVVLDEPVDMTKVQQPDSSGVIVLNPERKTADGKDAPKQEVIAPHNPWGVRVVTKDTMLSFTVRLDGIIIGTQPTALINGEPVRKGQTKIGPFILYRLRERDVLMQYNNVTFMLPIARTVTVRIPKL